MSGTQYHVIVEGLVSNLAMTFNFNLKTIALAVIMSKFFRPLNSNGRAKIKAGKYNSLHKLTGYKNTGYPQLLLIKLIV